MTPAQTLCFPPFRLDLLNQRLWREGQEIPLRQKTFAVLRYLVEHPEQLVTKAALLEAVWAGVYVSDVAPGVCIQELRRALGDDRKTPRLIVTVHRRGYRFIAPLSPAPPGVSRQYPVVSRRSAASGPHLATDNWPLATRLVGREAELRHLHQWLDKALSGERQIVFVTGEPGIGKTSLVEAFLARLASRPEPGHEHEHEDELWIGRGQCIEHYGAGEAYLPVLEALGRLCREPDGERLIELLSQYAPTWLVQMPALLTAADLEVLQRKTLGTTRERMLRELAEAVEALTAERPLILWLEDLHWSDVSTLDWLAFIARRTEEARLLVIGTYRPVEVLVREHPLKAVKQELQLHGRCHEVAVNFLSEAAVGEYLAVRFAVGARHAVPLQKLARAIHRRTDGNPLFMVNVVEDLVAQGVLVQSEGRWELQGGIEESATGVPETLQ